jgi:hypothetical protein
VSHHWFFGTNLWQPHLWIRGGCRGKVQRARVKLSRCDAEYRRLLQQVEHLQTIQLTRLEQAVQKGHEQVTASRTSIALRESMQEQLWTDYPSYRLIKFQYEAESLKEELCIQQEQVEHLEEAFHWYSQATQHYQQANETFQQSQELYDRYAHFWQQNKPEEMQEEDASCQTTNVVHADMNGHTEKCVNVILHRYPPPISPPPLQHGGRTTPCEQQQQQQQQQQQLEVYHFPNDKGDLQIWKAGQELCDREIQRTLDLCQELFHQGQEHMKRGKKMRQQAMTAEAQFRDTALSAATAASATADLNTPIINYTKKVWWINPFRLAIQITLLPIQYYSWPRIRHHPHL